MLEGERYFLGESHSVTSPPEPALYIYNDIDVQTPSIGHACEHFVAPFPYQLHDLQSPRNVLARPSELFLKASLYPYLASNMP